MKKQGWNIWPILGFIICIVTGGNLVGLALAFMVSLFGYSQIIKTGEKGKILSYITIFLALFLFFGQIILLRNIAIPPFGYVTIIFLYIALLFFLWRYTHWEKPMMMLLIMPLLGICGLVIEMLLLGIAIY